MTLQMDITTTETHIKLSKFFPMVVIVHSFKTLHIYTSGKKIKN